MLDAVDVNQFNLSLLSIMLTDVSLHIVIQKATAISELTVIVAEMLIHRSIMPEIIHTTLEIKLIILTISSIYSGNN